MARSFLLVALILSAGSASGVAQAAPALAPSRAHADAEENRRAGAAFLAANRAADGVVTLPSGLQYKILKAGTGRKPTLDDTVVVHYRGTFVDGTEFGSSYRTGQPGKFPLRAAIAGWREALQLMPAGSTWKLFVPPQLAYGERGAGKSIGPNATLVFETELVLVAQPPAGSAASAPRVAGIEVSFLLDPRFTRSLYMGDRWVSPATFSAPPQGKTSVVRVSVRGVDTSGSRVAIDPQWIPADPKMVEVTKDRASDVRIAVKRPGESKVRIVFQGVTKELAVKASAQGEGLAVEISQ